jgi:hypothetical protein
VLAGGPWQHHRGPSWLRQCLRYGRPLSSVGLRYPCWLPVSCVRRLERLRDSLGHLTYVGGSELLLGGNDTTAALSGVEGTVSLDDGLARASSAATGLAANLGDLVPVRHGGCDMCGG